MNSKHTVLIDTDGQLDSFWGLLCAKRTLNIRAVTVSAGKNRSLDQSADNILRFSALANLNCPISLGSDRTILNHPGPVWERFGQDGKLGLLIQAEPTSASSLPAWDCIMEEAEKAQGQLEILCFGPLTNLAISLFKYPKLPKLIKKVLIAGGSYDYGNCTAVTEINMATDPEAAKAVFQSGIPLEVYGFNAQIETSLQKEDILKLQDTCTGPGIHFLNRWREICSPAETMYCGPALTVLGCTDLEAVESVNYNMFVETKGAVCRGRTTPLNMYTPLDS